MCHLIGILKYIGSIKTRIITRVGPIEHYTIIYLYINVLSFYYITI